MKPSQPSASSGTDVTLMLKDPFLAREVPEAEISVVLESLLAQEASLEVAKMLLLTRLTSTRGQSVGVTPAGKLLTAAEVSAVLGIPTSFVYELIRRGSLPASAIGKYRRVHPADLEEFIRKNKLDAQPGARYRSRGPRKGSG